MPSDYDLCPDDPVYQAWLREQDRRNVENCIAVKMTLTSKKVWREIAAGDEAARHALARRLAEDLFSSFNIRRKDWKRTHSIGGGHKER
jgi:hypothetical protein